MSQAQWSMVNGELVAASEARLSVNDLGILRGFSLFDFFRVLGSNLFFWMTTSSASKIRQGK